jgi:glycosyltransferase involved in cell wall biosynthesis
MKSILGQSYQDMELIVSDNANSDETEEIIESFSSDPRVRSLRLNERVSVTENWNHALRYCSGDYILMMGDDDYLLPGYFERIDSILAKYNNPDCITYNAYTYVAPGSIRENKLSFFKETHFNFGSGFQSEGLISKEIRFSIVADMFRFVVRFPLNMQTTLISRRAKKKIVGEFFQPPFPDHYALNVLLLNAETWVYLPENVLVVGVSPKSFGHYVYSNKQKEGQAYLGIQSDFEGSLPGSELTNNMHVWLSLLKEKYKERLEGVEIGRGAYVRRQVYSWFWQFRFGGISTDDLVERARKLSFLDWMSLLGSIFDKTSLKRLFLVVRFWKRNAVHNLWHGLQPLDDIINIEDFACWINSRPNF